MSPEFSRPFAVARVGEEARVTVEADDAERAAVARRMGVPELLALACEFTLRPGPGRAILAHGVLRARVVQDCVLTLEPFEAAMAETFRLRFVPAEAGAAPFDPEADDEIPYRGGEIDLGEAAAEQLALAIDPFPRKPGARLPAPEAERDSPFEALARFDGVLGRKRD